MKHKSSDWLRVTEAAVSARDALRSEVVPGLDKAAGMVSEPEAQRLLQAVRDVAALQAV